MRITDFDDLTSALNPSLKTIVYITTGRKYAEMAIISAESLRPHNAGIQTVLSSDSMTDTPFIDFYTDLVSVFGRMQLPRTLAIKPAVLSKLTIGPFLYLDADTFVCGDLTPLWLGLRNYPILMT